MMLSIHEIFGPAMVKTEKSRLLVFPTGAGLAFLARVGGIAGFTGFGMRSVTKVFGARRRWLKKTGRFDVGAFARGVAEILVVRHRTAPNQPPVPTWPSVRFSMSVLLFIDCPFSRHAAHL